jgi:outer membrane immunogenic protein
MKKLLISSIAALGLLGTPTFATDMAVKAPPPPAPTPVFSWTGFYVGVNGGYGWGNHDVTFDAANDVAGPFITDGHVPRSVDSHANGGLIGGTIGYNWQWTPRFVFGLEADLDWADIKGSGSVATPAFLDFDPFNTFGEQKLTAFGTFRGRLGYAFDRVLVYGTGGLAYGRTELNTSIIDVLGGRLCGSPGLCATASTDKWRAGWTVGGGLEWAFSPPWSLKVEYLYYDLGSVSQTQFDPNDTPPLPIFTSSTDFRGNIVRGGVNYRF